MRGIRRFAVALGWVSAVLLITGSAAHGEERTRAHAADEVRATVLADVATIVPDSSMRVGVRFQIERDWYVYWKEPGDAGLAPTFSWTMPDGFDIEPLPWALPAWHKVEPNWTMVYERDALFVFRIKTPSTVPDVSRLTVNVDWLVCHDAKGCTPGSATLTLEIPKSANESATLSEHAARFDALESRLPRAMPDTWSFSPKKELVLRGDGPWQDEQATFDFYPETFAAFDRSAAPILLERDGHTVLRLPFLQPQGRIPDAFHGVLTIQTGETTTGYAVGWGERDQGNPSPNTLDEVVVTMPAMPATLPDVNSGIESIADPEMDDLRWAHGYIEYESSHRQENTSWWWALLLAFAGGLILNLMPCVLPVLSIKILGLVEHAGDAPAKQRRHGYAFALGIVASFLAIAGLLLSLRSAGEELGWGFQMQEPVVVAGLSIVMLLLGLNMFGVFEIGAGLSRLGGAHGTRGYWGSFATGILTTIVATPCTAPFMGTAIGYAATQPAVIALSVFGALGLGMSAPYVLITVFPKLVKWIPTPGPWMETLRHVLAFPILATVVWLTWLYGRQMGGDSVSVLLASLLCVAAAAWCYGRFGAIHRSAKVRWFIGRGLACALLLVGMAFVLRQVPEETAASTPPNGWEHYSGHAIRQYQDAGRPVFLDFTADWCLTCKANDAATLQSDTVANAFKRHGVIPMIADWTRRDDRISKALAKLGRNSIPVYVIVPPDPRRNVVVLRTAITPGYVSEALDRTLGK